MVDIPGETRGTLAMDYLTSFIEAGIPAKDIIKALTINAAYLAGLDQLRGLIKPGYMADIIAVKESPLANI